MTIASLNTEEVRFYFKGDGGKTVCVRPYERGWMVQDGCVGHGYSKFTEAMEEVNNYAPNATFSHIEVTESSTYKMIN